MDTRSRIIIAAGFVLAAGGGYFFGQRSAPQPSIDIPVMMPNPSAGSAAAVAQSTATDSRKTPTRVSTLHEILQLKGDFAQTTALYLLASQLDSKGIQRLLDEADTIASESDRRGARGILYGRLAEQDPEAAIRRIMQSAEQDFGALQTVFQYWSRLDLQRALTRAAALDDDRSRAVALRAILVARSELPEAEREALARKYKVRMALPGTAVAMDVRTPESAARSWRAALALKDPMQRSSQLGQLASLWARQSPDAALRAIEEIDDPRLRAMLLTQSTTAWAGKAPRDALDWAMARKPSQERAQMLSGILRTMLKEDPRGALEQAQQLSRPERMQVLPQLVYQWANEDVQAAADWLATIRDPSMRSASISAIANGLAARNPEEALRWATSLSKSESQYVIPTIITQLAEKDPARGVAVLNTLQDQTQRESAAMGLAQSWARSNPGAAANWAVRLPPTPSRASIVGLVFSQWASYDAPAALQQLGQLTDPSVRDNAAVALISNDFLEPELSLQLYDRIESPDLQRHAAMRLYYKYRESDPALAERFKRDIGAR